MKQTPVVVIALLIGAALGVWIGRTTKSNTTTMILESGGKVIPHVAAGETLQWVDRTLKGFDVALQLGGGLCKEEDKNHNVKNGTCTVKKSVGAGSVVHYRYSCGNCGDPDVGAGSDVGSQGGGGGGTGLATALNPILTYCDGTVPKADPPLMTVPEGSTIYWGATDSSVSGWTASGLTTVCGVDSISSGTTGCTIKSGTYQGGPHGNGLYDYSVKVTGCGNAPGTAQLQITKP